jgi:hypothetical protein
LCALVWLLHIFWWKSICTWYRTSLFELLRLQMSSLASLVQHISTLPKLLFWVQISFSSLIIVYISEDLRGGLLSFPLLCLSFIFSLSFWVLTLIVCGGMLISAAHSFSDNRVPYDSGKAAINQLVLGVHIMGLE